MRRGATPSAANNRLGRIKFDGTAGSNQGAWIQAQSDAAWTLNSDQPTHLAFGTCAASSASPTERLRITSDGTLQLRNSPGIDFSQIQTNAAGVTSETLDSYEEGSWLPELQINDASTGIAYSVRAGTYTKLGVK